jgi:hypothetical protein
MSTRELGKINPTTMTAQIELNVLELIGTKLFKKYIQDNFIKEKLTTYETNTIYYIFFKPGFFSSIAGVFCFITSVEGENITVKEIVSSMGSGSEYMASDNIDYISLNCNYPGDTIIKKTHIKGVLPYSTIQKATNKYIETNPNVLTCVRNQKEKVAREAWVKKFKDKPKPVFTAAPPSHEDIARLQNDQSSLLKVEKGIHELEIVMMDNKCNKYLGGGKRRTNKNKKTIKRNKSKGKKSRRNFINK